MIKKWILKKGWNLVIFFNLTWLWNVKWNNFFSKTFFPLNHRLAKEFSSHKKIRQFFLLSSYNPLLVSYSFHFFYIPHHLGRYTTSQYSFKQHLFHAFHFGSRLPAGFFAPTETCRIIFLRCIRGSKIDINWNGIEIAIKYDCEWKETDMMEGFVWLKQKLFHFRCFVTLKEQKWHVLETLKVSNENFMFN